MSDQALTPYKKVIVINNGRIDRMYWEHPAGSKEITVSDVTSRWDELHPDIRDYASQKFLVGHGGFASKNIIRDGYRADN